MEKFYRLLRRNNTIINKNKVLPRWAEKYMEEAIPSHFYILDKLLDDIPKDAKVIELGAGTGDITAFLLTKGFYNLHAYERDKYLAELAEYKVNKLFCRNDVIINQEFPNGVDNADLLLQYNCVYWDFCTTKDEYKEQIKFFYKNAGYPKFYFLEVIDAELSTNDGVFPKIVWLTQNDIKEIFPNHNIYSVQSKKRPLNGIYKRLYKLVKVIE